jgi:hypothetical protein
MSDDPAAPVVRVRPGQQLDERGTLAGHLDWLRSTVVHKVSGLSDEQACSRPVPASELTPAGLVKHLTGTERWWFSIDFADSGAPHPWPDGSGDGGFTIGPGDTLDALVAAYQQECARSRQVVAAAGLDDVSRGALVPPFTLRFALTHMIEETARHCGHLDLLRESIDGARGQ